MSNTVQRFGQTIELNEMPVTSPYAQSFWSAAARGWDTGWESTKTRWGALFENAPQMSYEAFVAKYGDDVAFAYNPGVNEYNADYLAWEAKTQLHAQQYQGRPIAEFLGAIVPSLPDPVNVATLPVGGARAAAAATSKSASGFLKNSAIAGFQAGAASLPLEVAMQQEVYGEIRPEELALSVVAPVALSPVLTAPGFVVSRIKQGKLQRAVDEQMDLPPTADREQVAQVFEDSPDATLPPQAPTPVEPPAPTLRMFDEFGGETTWAMAAARGDVKAREFALANNIDPDSPALKAFFVAESNRQAVLGEADPAKNADTALVLGAWQRGDQTPEVRQALVDAGVAREVEGELRILPQFRELAELMKGEDTGPALRQFMDSSPDQISARYQQKLWNDLREVQQSSLAREAKAARTAEILAEMEESTGGARTLKPDFDRDALLDALDAARLESPTTAAELRGGTGDSPMPETSPVDPVTPAGMDTQTADARAAAQKAGVELDAVDNIVDDVIERMTRCGA